ncbi:hypothetical protein FE394_09715 [Xenorhabdus sp. Reich]|uniref:Uncharacterized protein n=1 Tax=Xenorhabdus littoralis TaxID=2582835 RepID=A0ABU4SLH7_9GAMM|nr:hypothetical protein [Xenorhabdus sp. Reich]MDX7999470.1 hypothetical protein [Xenorhabdus sp. Reich]
MRNDNNNRKSWCTRRLLTCGLGNRAGGENGESIGDQWASNRIKRYYKDAPKKPLTSLLEVYENKMNIINHNCLDLFDTKRNGEKGKWPLKPQQPHATLDEIYILERIHHYSEENNDAYYRMKCVNQIETHVPNGSYLYVIYSDLSQIIVCCRGDGTSFPMLGHSSVIKARLLLYRCDGNTSQINNEEIDYAQYPVLLAGELFFMNGKLTMWNNRSGHYRPRGDPVLKFKATDHILPRKLFRLV